MIKQIFAKLMFLSSISLLLVGCSGSVNNDKLPKKPMVEPGDIFALTISNKLISFNRDTPGSVRTTLSITGMQQGENLVGIDYRPADGLLYGVGNTGRIYEINTSSGAATVKSTLAADSSDTTSPYTGLNGTEFGVDFNPVVDRLRVVSNTGQNLRINVDTGATTTDDPINGGAANTSVTASAYTNSFATTGTTTLYAIDSTNGTLYTQNPPNNGTMIAPIPLGVGASNANGFDIDARTNTGYAVFTVGSTRSLYSINLAATSNAATLVGPLGVTEDIRGIAVRTPQAPIVYGLTDDDRLVSFKPLTPNTLDTTVVITGLNAGEKLLGIDMRPKDVLLYGISSGGRIVTIDPATGAATVKATLAADATDATNPYVSISGTVFAVDFNPVADRLRVISDAGQNLRINVDTGATTTDNTINGTDGNPVVSAAAYTNNFAGATATMLMDINTSNDNLALQNPPNEGTLTNVGSLGTDVAGDVGMDIAGGANGLALAALRTSVGGPTSLYRIDLVTGAATLINGTANPGLSVVGNGMPGLRDIAISIK